MAAVVVPGLHLRFVEVLERALTVAIPAAGLAWLAWSSGAYFPETWGGVFLAEAVVLAGCGLLVSQVELSRRDAVLVGGFAALAAWQLASRSWGVAPDGSVLEAERTLLYAGTATAALVAVPRSRRDDLVVGVLAGTSIVTIGGLVEHVVGDGGERLEEPIGYANASGILATTTILLGVGLAREGPRWQRVVGACAAVPAAVVLYLTLSRGAMVACAVGLAALAVAARPRRISRAGVLLSVAVVVAVGAVVAVHEVSEVRSAPADQQAGSARLVSGSTSFRADYWDVAVGMVERAPLRGEGAGSFAPVWLRERDRPIHVQDAHNLYLETLAETGVVGMVALLVALGVPLLGSRRAACHAGARAALAAYVALLAHAAVDWDWELPAVTVALILLGVVVMRAGTTGRSVELTVPRRVGVLAAAVGLAATALVVRAGNTALVDAHAALDRGDAREAARQAQRARRFAPWAAEPWRLLGEAEAARGRLALAERHIGRAIDEDPDAWESWLALAFATRGANRARAVDEARRRNPLAPELDVFGRPDP